MAMQYPILFPYGEDGYMPNILTSNAEDDLRDDSLDIISNRAFIAYQLQFRLEEAHTLLLGGRLLQQYIVDAFTCIEAQRLRWYQDHQSQVRAELYQNLADVVVAGDTRASSVGRRIVLPSSFTVAVVVVREEQGMLILKSSKGTRVYIEPDIPEVAKLKKSLQNAPTRKRTVMPAIEPKTIMCFKQLMRQQLQGSGICHAKVIKVYQTGNWSYPSCQSCRRKPSLREGRTYCKDCKAYVTKPVFRYIIQIRIKDASGEIDGTAFEEAGTELVGLTSDELSAMHEDVTLGYDAVYDKLEEMVGKNFYFNLKVTEYNVEDPSKPVTISMA